VFSSVLFFLFFSADLFSLSLSIYLSLPSLSFFLFLFPFSFFLFSSFLSFFFLSFFVRAQAQSVVANVKNIAKQREERRAKQSEQKQEINQRGGRATGAAEFSAMVEQYRLQAFKEPMRGPSGAPTVQKISVCVRKRPLNSRENAAAEVDVVSIPTADAMIVHECKSKVDLTKYLEHHNFRFDYSFNEDIDNRTVYRSEEVKSRIEG
jgi:hypothetical protein